MRKRMMTLTLFICVSFALSGCGKASKQEIIESEYYQKLQDQNEKLSQDLKRSRAREDSLDKKIKEIHEYTGDQKLAAYKKEWRGAPFQRQILSVSKRERRTKVLLSRMSRFVIL